jgi:spore coat polysaccharide biosynthesis protein SpsF (cytidylyltransferase family)
LRRPEFRLTVDTPEDLDLAREIFKSLYKKGSIISLSDVIQLLDDNPDLCKINSMIKQKDPFNKSF